MKKKKMMVQEKKNKAKTKDEFTKNEKERK
jgi:hypothetical protein